MAVDYWDPETRELVLDADIYDEKSKTWVDKDTSHLMKKYTVHI